jgi:hypothetical protein
MEQNVTNLYYRSKKISLLLMAVSAFLCTRLLFLFFNDPEGPNLFIVTVFALGIYALSTAAYLFGPSKIKGIQRISAAICIQILSVVVLYFCMR